MGVREAVLQDKPVRVGPLAREVGVSAATLYSLIRQEKIEVIRVGRSVIVPPRAARPLLGMPEHVQAAA